MCKYEYVGCFFDFDELMKKVQSVRRNPLKNVKRKPHVTFIYAPEYVDEKLFGIDISVTIIGYGNDGENEGVKVVLHSENEAINHMIKNIPVPHITLAVSDNGKAVNTRYLTFEDIEPIEIIGKYDGHID